MVPLLSQTRYLMVEPKPNEDWSLHPFLSFFVYDVTSVCSQSSRLAWSPSSIIIHHHPSSSIIIHHHPSSILIFSSSLNFMCIIHRDFLDVYFHPSSIIIRYMTRAPTALRPWPKALLSGVRDLVLRPAFFLLGAFADGRMGPQRHARTYHFSQLPFIRNMLSFPGSRQWKITILNRRFVLKKTVGFYIVMFIFGGVNAIESGIQIGGAKEVADWQCWIGMPGTRSAFYVCFFHPWSFSPIKARVLQGCSSCIVWEVSQ